MTFIFYKNKLKLHINRPNIESVFPITVSFEEDNDNEGDVDEEQEGNEDEDLVRFLDEDFRYFVDNKSVDLVDGPGDTVKIDRVFVATCGW